MGLDQFAYKIPKVSKIENNKDVEFLKEMSLIETEPEEIHYWRKHPNIQGLMEEIWLSKGNEGKFNCEKVYLSLEDIEGIEEKIKNSDLPETSGFFFGRSSGGEEEKEDDLAFIQKAKNAIDEGYDIFYSSWW